MRTAPMMEMIAKEAGNKLLIGAEIGVFRGEHAKLILEILKMERLYLIDPYDPDISDFEGHMKTKITGALSIAKQVLRHHDNVVKWIHEISDDALDSICDYLDFAYLDGNHSYRYIFSDACNYFGLIRSGGFLGGHDYMMRSSPLIEVKNAVDDFAAKMDLKVSSSNGEFPDWWIRKP